MKTYRRLCIYMSLQWLFYILSLNSFINVLLILRFKKHKYIIYSAYIVCINQILIVILTNCVLCVLHVTSTVWWRGSTRALRWHLDRWCTSHHRRTLKPKRERHLASRTSERRVKPRSEEWCATSRKQNQLSYVAASSE